MKPKVILLKRTERVIAVVPETCQGSGWSNMPTFVYIQNATGDIRCVCIQPEEASNDLRTLFHAGAAMHRSLIMSVPTKMEDV